MNHEGHMNNTRRLQLALLLCLIFFTLACRAGARVSTGDVETDGGARAFVQDFYGWYVPKSLEAPTTPPWRIVLQERANALEPALSLALKQDIDAQDRVAGEIVGLDFDPFLFSQDPCERYEVVEMKQRGPVYDITIHSFCDGAETPQAIVVAEVAKRGNRYVILNLHYPEGKDLLTILKLLRDGRR